MIKKLLASVLSLAMVLSVMSSVFTVFADEAAADVVTNNVTFNAEGVIESDDSLLDYVGIAHPGASAKANELIGLSEYSNLANLNNTTCTGKIGDKNLSFEYPLQEDLFDNDVFTRKDTQIGTPTATTGKSVADIFTVGGKDVWKTKEVQIDYTINLGTKIDVKGLLLSTVNSKWRVGAFEIYASNDLDTLYTTPVATITVPEDMYYDIDKATTMSQVLVNNSLDAFKVAEGKELKVQYVGFRVKKITIIYKSDYTDAHFQTLRFSQIGVYGACPHDADKKIEGAKEPLHVTPGYTGDTLCALCGALVETGKEIEPKGEHVWFVDHKTKLNTCDCGETSPYDGDKLVQTLQDLTIEEYSAAVNVQGSLLLNKPAEFTFFNGAGMTEPAAGSLYMNTSDNGAGNNTGLTSGVLQDAHFWSIGAKQYHIASYNNMANSDRMDQWYQLTYDIGSSANITKIAIAGPFHDNHQKLCPGHYMISIADNKADLFTDNAVFSEEFYNDNDQTNNNIMIFNPKEGVEIKGRYFALRLISTHQPEYQPSSKDSWGRLENLTIEGTCLHDVKVTVGAAQALHFTDGYTGDVKCKACGELMSKGEVIPAVGDCVFVIDHKTKIASCECGEEYDYIDDKFDHQAMNWSHDEYETNLDLDKSILLDKGAKFTYYDYDVMSQPQEEKLYLIQNQGENNTALTSNTATLTSEPKFKNIGTDNDSTTTYPAMNGSDDESKKWMQLTYDFETIAKIDNVYLFGSDLEAHRQNLLPYHYKISIANNEEDLFTDNAVLTEEYYTDNSNAGSNAASLISFSAKDGQIIMGRYIAFRFIKTYQAVWESTANSSNAWVRLRHISAFGCIHPNTEVRGAVTATCGKAGYTGDTYCLDCQQLVTKGEVIAATGAHKYGSYVSDGTYHWKKCSCGAITAKAKHTSKTSVTKKAKTSANGTQVTTCTTCKKTLKTTTIYKASSVKLSTTEYEYNGKTKKPSVKVYDSKGKKLVYGTDYTYKRPSSSKKVGKYSIKVTFKGKYTGTKTLYYTINPADTKITSLKAESKKLTVKWSKKTKYSTGYQIQYSTSSKFSSKYTKTVTIKKDTTTSKTISKLKAKKKYYVRVRCYYGTKTKYYSDWSSKKSTTTKK